MSERNPDELGALWLKKGGKGPYMTGTINGVNVFCTPVKSENAKAPTWRVMKSKPKPPAEDPPDALTDDGIPF